LLEFVFAGPLVSVTWLQLELLAEEVVRRVHESAIVFRIEVDVDVTGQGSVLVPDHGRAAGKRNARDLLDRDLCTGRCRNQDAAQLLHVVTEVAVVADVYWVSFAAFDIFRDHFPADSRTDGLLDISDG
jgi:hypothetical protein